MPKLRFALPVAAGLAIAVAPLAAQQTCPAMSGGSLPLKYTGGPTVPAITPCDLMTRLYIYSDDSMQGREVGTPAHLRATAYIEEQVRKLGLVPAGDSGGYFQNLPVFGRAFDTASTITVGDSTFHGGADLIAQASGTFQQLDHAPTIYAGVILDTNAVLPADSVAGKVLVFLPPKGAVNSQAIQGTAGFMRWYKMYQSGVARVVILPIPAIPPAVVARATQPNLAFLNEAAPVTLNVTMPVATALFSGPINTIAVGTAGAPITTQLHFTDTPRPGRNVVAVLPGRDPRVSGEYVAIGAHNDHIGISPVVVDHDSLKVFNEFARPQGADGGPTKTLTPEEWARVNAMIDSLHKLHGGPRPDSINNGADDDGSGSVSLLEIAEAFAKGNVKPRRSMLFIWHAGEEKGLWGSQYFTDHPTVPRDSIVAELNIDMIGRGLPADETGVTKDGQAIFGSSNYLQVVGSRRLSTELGDLTEKVNNDEHLGIHFDYAMDANGHPENIYCRSDHAEYARYGIPIVFFTTGGHADYHQVTDEAQYIDYRHMSVVAHLVFDLGLRVADLDHRVVVDHPKPDPHGNCQQ